MLKFEHCPPTLSFDKASDLPTTHVEKMDLYLPSTLTSRMGFLQPPNTYLTTYPLIQRGLDIPSFHPPKRVLRHTQSKMIGLRFCVR